MGGQRAERRIEDRRSPLVQYQRAEGERRLYRLTPADRRAKHHDLNAVCLDLSPEQLAILDDFCSALGMTRAYAVRSLIIDDLAKWYSRVMKGIATS